MAKRPQGFNKYSFGNCCVIFVHYGVMIYELRSVNDFFV
jgi:hypothetical protein